MSIVNVMPVAEALEYFQKNLGSQSQFDRARRFATGDFPKLYENKLETDNRVQLRIPYTMRQLLSDGGKGVSGLMLQALAEDTQLQTTNCHGSDLNRKMFNPRGYLCDIKGETVGMTGPCNLLFAVDAANRANALVMRTQNPNGASPEVENAIKLCKNGEASQWHVRASSVSSWRDPTTGKLLSTQLTSSSPATSSSTSSNLPFPEEASSSSSGGMNDDERALLDMQEEMGRMSVSGGIPLAKPYPLFKGAEMARQKYDTLGALTKQSLEMCSFRMRKKDKHVFVLAHSVLGVRVMGEDVTLCYYSEKKVDALPSDELGYVLRVPESVAARARDKLLEKAKLWESATVNRVEDLHVRIRPATLGWRYNEEDESYTRGNITVGADDPFFFYVSLCVTQRHYHTEGCGALLPHFIKVWPRPVFRSGEVDSKTGVANKDAQNLVWILDDTTAMTEDKLDLYSKMSEADFEEKLSDAGYTVDEEGRFVPSASSSSSSSSESTNAVDDD